MLKLKVSVADDSTSDGIIATLFIALDLHLTPAIVNQLVHQAVEQRVRPTRVDLVRALLIVEVIFLDLRELTSCDSYHPHELGYVITAEVSEATKDDKDIVGSHEPRHVVTFLLC